MSIIVIFYLLFIGHMVGDFVLQPSPMSSGKNRHNNLREQYGESFPHWYYWLTAHSLTHSGLVYIITQNFWISIVELVSHWIIDYFKCERWISLNQDQILHLLFKVGYCAYIYYAL